MPDMTLKATAIITLSTLVLPGSAYAQQPPPGMAKAAFAEILAAADKDQDGSLSLEECYVLWKNKATAEQKCNFWDVNKDGVITEEEYVAQAGSLMK